MPADESNDSFTELFAEYDDLANDVERSKASSFRSHVQRWLDFLDRIYHLALPILRELETSIDLDDWTLNQGNFISEDPTQRFDWPDNQRQRLGVQLQILRRIAANDEATVVIGMHLDSEPTEADTPLVAMGMRKLKQQLFRPIQGELRHYLQNRLRSPGEIRWTNSAGQEIRWVNAEGDHLAFTSEAPGDSLPPGQQLWPNPSRLIPGVEPQGAAFQGGGAFQGAGPRLPPNWEEFSASALAHMERVAASLKALEPFAGELDAILIDEVEESTPGPGHNNPPKELGTSADTIRLGIDAANVFRSTVASNDPDFKIVAFCHDALVVVGKWAARVAERLKKLKKVGQAALVVGGIAGVAFVTAEAEIIAPHLNKLIEETCGVKIPWLEPMPPGLPIPTPANLQAA